MTFSPLLLIVLLLTVHDSAMARTSILEDLKKIKEASSGLEVIYGKDNRLNVTEQNNPIIDELSKSVAMRVSKRRLLDDRDNESLYIITARTLSGTVAALCEDEAFKDEVSLGDCSGVLIAPNRLLTAGHCVKDQAQCESYRWVFNYTENTDSLEKSQVYSCSKIIDTEYRRSFSKVKDYAIIELDREVPDYRPLTLRKEGKISLNTPVFTIGHPMGLPMKVTDGGQVMGMNLDEEKNPIQSKMQRRYYFTANLDSYSGNSGSPVFNQETGDLEGIVIQGTKDFEYNYSRDCQESVKLPDNHKNTYERVMRITKIPGLH